MHAKARYWRSRRFAKVEAGGGLALGRGVARCGMGRGLRLVTLSNLGYTR